MNYCYRVEHRNISACLYIYKIFSKSTAISIHQYECLIKTSFLLDHTNVEKQLSQPATDSKNIIWYHMFLNCLFVKTFIQTDIVDIFKM